jgi:hypothetical protein
MVNVSGVWCNDIKLRKRKKKLTTKSTESTKKIKVICFHAFVTFVLFVVENSYLNGIGVLERWFNAISLVENTIQEFTTDNTENTDKCKHLSVLSSLKIRYASLLSASWW